MNRQSRLAVRPEATAMVDQDTWGIFEAEVPEPGAGQVLVCNIYVSVDPAMRGWIRPNPIYIEPVEVDEVIRVGTVGRVVISKNPDFGEGDYVSDVEGDIGFQNYGLSEGKVAGATWVS